MKNETSIQIDKPERWDHAFDPNMTDADVQEVLTCQAFSPIEQKKFPKTMPLDAIIRNDGAIRHYEPGDILIKEGEYGQTAFFILSGEVVVLFHNNLVFQQQTGEIKIKKNFKQLLAQLFNETMPAETRDISKYQNDGHHIENNPNAHFKSRYRLKNYQQYTEASDAISLSAPDYIGEISAIKHSPRTATVVAKNKVKVFEIRWQGLKEILNRSTYLSDKMEISRKLRGTSNLLTQVDLFKKLSPNMIENIDNHLLHEEFGDAKWYLSYEKLHNKTGKARLKNETLIVKEGEHIDGLLIVRRGFVRVSVELGNGFHPLGFLSVGDTIGLEELKYQFFNQTKNTAWQCTLHAIGYAEIVWVPTPIIFNTLFKVLKIKPSRNKDYSQLCHQYTIEDKLPKTINELYQTKIKNKQLDPGLSEFLIASRFINGSATMVINLEKCVHCDDCVKACSRAHNNNPRFLRQGEKYKNLMFANACMHCHDAPCLVDCPTGAMQRDKADGLTLIDDVLCIGCGNCASNCPYNAIRLVEISDDKGRKIKNQKGQAVLKATKCDYCIDQVVSPSCQQSCPHGALERINWKNMDHPVSWLKAL